MDEVPGPAPLPGPEEPSVAEYQAAPMEPPLPAPPPLGRVPLLLGQTAPWAYLLAIVGFLSVALMIVAGVGAGAVGLATGRAETAILMAIYPLSALIYFFPSLYMLQYAKRSRKFAQDEQSLAGLEAALDAQRKFFKFAGIATVLAVALGVLMFVGVVLFSLLARASGV